MPTPIFLSFDGDLPMLLSKQRAGTTVEYPLSRRASIKDIIESLGVPHVEVARIVQGDRELGFSCIPEGGEHFDIVAFFHEIWAGVPSLLRPEPVYPPQFMVDINVAKLARNLRMIGFDTTLVPDLPLVGIAALAASQKRILLSRNRELLKCKVVVHGQLLRSQEHISQLQEVVIRYRLKLFIKPFCRCLACNGNLRAVAKAAINDRLKPLTRKYYHSFKQCSTCQKIYWQGSHHNNMHQALGAAGPDLILDK